MTPRFFFVVVVKISRMVAILVLFHYGLLLRIKRDTAEVWSARLRLSCETYSIFILRQLGGIWNGCRWTNQDCFSVHGRVIIMGGQRGLQWEGVGGWKDCCI